MNINTKYFLYADGLAVVTIQQDTFERVQNSDGNILNYTDTQVRFNVTKM